MRVELFCLCDFASADASGKMNLIGVFDSIQAEELPMTQSLLAIAGKVSFAPSEAGSKKFTIRISDPDGKPLMPLIEAEADITLLPGESSANAQMILLVSQMRLQSFGSYSIEMAIENAPIALTVLTVRKPLSR